MGHACGLGGVAGLVTPLSLARTGLRPAAWESWLATRWSSPSTGWVMGRPLGCARGVASIAPAPRGLPSAAWTMSSPAMRRGSALVAWVMGRPMGCSRGGCGAVGVTAVARDAPGHGAGAVDVAACDPAGRESVHRAADGDVSEAAVGGRVMRRARRCGRADDDAAAVLRDVFGSGAAGLVAASFVAVGPCAADSGAAGFVAASADAGAAGCDAAGPGRVGRVVGGAAPEVAADAGAAGCDVAGPGRVGGVVGGAAPEVAAGGWVMR